MYALCDATKDLSHCVFMNASYAESIRLYHRLFPNVKTLLVFRDLYGMREVKHLTFVSRVTNSIILRLSSPSQTKKS